MDVVVTLKRVQAYVAAIFIFVISYLALSMYVDCFYEPTIIRMPVRAIKRK